MLKTSLVWSMHYESAAAESQRIEVRIDRKICETMALYLERKTPLSANDLSPVVIAVLNGSGELVMESIVETKSAACCTSSTV